MNNEHFHPVLTQPPLAHALHHWDEETGLLTYEYNGTTVLSVQVPPHTDLGFRHGSDGSMQSVQYMQQIYLAAEPACTARVTLRGHAGALNLRPHRARQEEAILGAQPDQLYFGVNGFYDPQWDLLLDWHGKDWRWLDVQTQPDTDGFVSATFETQLDLQALYINLRPRYYAKHLGYHYHRPWVRRPKQEAVAGWCSWEAYRRDISQEKIEAVAEFLSRSLARYGLSYLQVDDGYQAMPLPVRGDMTMPEGWMTCDSEKFPKGHEGIVNAIRDQGLTPAVWVNANITNPDFPKNHPEAVVWDGDEALKGEWIDFLYSCTPETLAIHVEPLFRALREKGYRYVKIDAIRHLLFDGLHECVRLGLMTDEDAEQRFRAYMEAGRKGMGEDLYYLASWGEMHEVVGVVDACRISMDANPTWAGIRMQLFESARWFHTHRILFLNDPDHVCVRTKADWAKSVLSLISLSGELCMLSDTQQAYTPEKTYIAYDFWKQEYLGEVRGSFSCPALELGCCQVVAFYEKGDAPMVIASDRHVSMDAVSVLEHTWEHGVLSLRLKGVPGDTRRYQVWLPQGMQAASLRMKGCTAQLNAGQPAAITVTFEEEEAQVWLSVNG